MPRPAEEHETGRGSWSDLRTRVASAALMGPLGILGIWIGAWVWAVLAAVAGAGMGLEWIGLCRADRRGFAGVAVPVVTLAAVLVAGAGAPLAALGVLGLGTAVVWLAAPGPAALGIPYVGLGGIAVVWLRASGPVGFANLLFLVFVVWASDIGAYAVGRLVGGRKLAPRISPGKTWSGAVGGLLAAMLAGLGVAMVAGPPGGLRALLVAGVLGVVSQAGDLLESAVKRHFGVKDSGGLIPGHGGLLDRLDGLLVAAPVAALFALGSGAALWQ